MTTLHQDNAIARALAAADKLKEIKGWYERADIGITYRLNETTGGQFEACLADCVGFSSTLDGALDDLADQLDRQVRKEGLRKVVRRIAR